MHVGVASARHYISIEERARRFGYENKDFLGRHAPLDGTSQLAGFVDRQWSVDEGRGQLEATVSVADVATSITQLGLADVHVSDDPGARYQRTLVETSQLTLPTPNRPIPLRVHILCLSRLRKAESNVDKLTAQARHLCPHSRVRCIPSSRPGRRGRSHFTMLTRSISCQ